MICGNIEKNYLINDIMPLVDTVKCYLSDFYLNNIDDSKINRYFERDNLKYISFKNKITT